MNFWYSMFLAVLAIADLAFLILVCVRRVRMRRTRTERMYRSLALAIRRELQQDTPSDQADFLLPRAS